MWLALAAITLDVAIGFNILCFGNSALGIVFNEAAN
jgi:hypothetical protein